MKQHSQTLPRVVIVGRTNVGKSSLFNRIAGRRKAIVGKAEATTRDRISEIINYSGQIFELIDTGGIDFNYKKEFFAQVEKQVMTGIRQADGILFVCDAKAGVTPLDQRICELLRRFNKRVMLVVNKADNKVLSQNSTEFYSLGMGEPIAVSSTHGLGIGDLLDVITAGMGGVARGADMPKVTRLAVVGRPNSGKSSFVNSVLGEERVIVSEEPGTTRDSVDSYFEMDGKGFVIIDTAGIRSRGKIKDDTTYFSIVRTEASIKRSDAAIILLDGTLGVTKEDFKIIGIVQDSLKPFVLAVNKWDLCLKEGLNTREYEMAVRRTLRFAYNAPVVFMSALTGKDVKKAIVTALALAERSRENFSSSRLNEILRKIRIGEIRLYSIRQKGNSPPEFEIFVRKPASINESTGKHIINVLRKELKLEGVPIKINFKKKRF